MSNQFLVEVKQTIMATGTIEAESYQDAQEQALNGLGEFSEPIHGEVEIVVIRPLGCAHGQEQD